MDRFHVAIITTAIGALQVLGASRTFGQGQARLVDNLEAGEATRGSVHSQGSSALQAFSRVPLAFIENRGQFDQHACFAARRGGVTAYFTRNAFLLQLVSRAPQRPLTIDLRRTEASAADAGMCGANLFLTFEGASDDVIVEGLGALPGHYNYLIGNDPSKWCTDVPAYASIGYLGLYAGIDLVVHDQEGRLEYDLLLAPGADPAQIVVRCEGAESLSIDEDGSLVIATAAGPLKQPRPATYQVDDRGDREPIECSYRLLGEDCFGFHVPAHALEKQLVIDPGLIYSTFVGGSGDDAAGGFTVDSTGAVIIIGHTDSTNYPTTPGAYDTSYNGGRYDGIVTKLSADGTSLVYSTFFGGSGDDHYPVSIAVDDADAVIFTGQTDSTDFPTTPGAYDTTYNGSGDAFVAKLSANGQSLLFSTFLGGSATEVGQDIALDATAAILVSGITASANFPITPGAYDTTYNGGAADAFAAKLSADGSSLLYSTFLGGSSDDGHDVRPTYLSVDATGAAHVAGTTWSSDFPTTPGAYDTTYNGDGDTFVAKLSANGQSLLHSTFLGGSALNYPGRIAVDATGATLVTITTYSADFPTTPGAYDTTFNGFIDGVVTKLSANGESLVYSTFLGGTTFDGVSAVAVDTTSAAVVTGATDSSDFPTTPGAYDTTYNGGSADTFVAKLSADGSSLLYSTFLGGSNGEGAGRIVVDAAGALIVAMATESPDFPTTPGAYDTTYNGGFADGVVTKLSTESGDCSGDPGFTLAVPPEAPIGEFIDICTSAPGGDLVALLGSLGQGPTVTPFGTFCLDFPPLVLFTFVMPGGGNRCFHRYVGCERNLVGVTGYLQFIALTPAGNVDGLSNQSAVTVVDHGACG